MLEGLAQKQVLVLGDFFLDKYLVIDPERNELSLETGLTAYQVDEVYCSPGAAGTVANNLAALGFGRVIALGVVGDDGNGYELQRGLKARGIVTDYLVMDGRRKTPTYMKPMLREKNGSRELNRLDIKNFEPTPEDLIRQIEQRLQALAAEVDGIAVLDQVTEANCGVVTDYMRTVLTKVAQTYPNLPIIVDSRAHIGLFKGVMIKPNAREAMTAVGAERDEEPELTAAVIAGQKLHQMTKRPVYLTLGARGQIVVDAGQVWHVPTINVPEPIDIVGAGDSTTAGIMSGLVLGLSVPQAALLGNVVASITIQQIGTTGTASPSQVAARMQVFTAAGIVPQTLR